MSLNKYQKGDFTSSIVVSIKNQFFIFKIPLKTNPTKISGYSNLWDIFSFIYRQLRMTFFHKIMVTEKKLFAQNNEKTEFRH